MDARRTSNSDVLRSVYDQVRYGAGNESLYSSLVLDRERGEIAMARGRMAKRRGISDIKAALALKNHSEAERRRRQRINTHLAKLRGLISTTTKLDKAALLAEVVKEVKELKRRSVVVSNRCNVPSDTDEVRVEVIDNGLEKGCFVVKATLCCEDRPELLTELKQTFKSLQLKTVNAEISILGGRVKHVCTMTTEEAIDDSEMHLLTNSVQQELKSLLDRVSAESDFSLRSSLYGKRQRLSPFESSGSSS